MAKTWVERPPRYDNSDTDTGSDSDDNYSSSCSSGDSRFRERPLANQPVSPDQQQRKSTLVLFGGVAVAILLVLLGVYALYKYFGGETWASGAGGSGGNAAPQIVTVTETLAGQGVTTIISTKAPAATGSSTTGGDSDDSSTGSNTTTSGSASNGSIATTQPGLARNNIGIGFLPDYNNQNMAKINEGLGIKASYYGWYAQLPASGDWDGSQLLSQLDDVKSSGAIFQPAVMPTNGWAGLTQDNNTQALAIARVMKQFTDEGIEVWLRFAHEVNYYLTDGTYQGTVDDFKPAWEVVAAAVADNPLVKMFFTPNTASAGLTEYEEYFPDDLSTVDYLGLDYYPTSSSAKFLDQVQDMYDKWCSNGTIKFAMGETGTSWNTTIEERLAWLDQLTSEETATAMPNYVGISWFNYDKEQVFYLYDGDSNETTAATKAWIASENTTASGAAMGNA